MIKISNFFCFIISFLGFFCFATPPIKALQNDKIMAVVNKNHVIFNFEFNQKIKFNNILEQTKSSATSEEIKKVVLNQLISNYLFLQEAIKYNTTVTEAEVLTSLNGLEEKMNLSKGTLLEQGLKAGLSKDIFLKQLKDEIIVDRIKQNYIFSRVKLSTKEIEEELNRLLSLNNKLEYLVSEISIPFTETSKVSAENKINLAYNQLTKGETFAKVANHFSEDNFFQTYRNNITIQTLTQSNLGNLEKNPNLGYWIPEDYITPEILNEIRSIKPQEFTRPISLRSYYKIILLLEIRPLLQINPNNPEHTEQLKQFIQQKLFYEKSQIILEEYTKEIFQSASVVVY
ncbi:putative peptidylprolyl isomerase [Candidatus Hepatincolaceae symbiont of Richtersius coronifer]